MLKLNSSCYFNWLIHYAVVEKINISQFFFRQKLKKKHEALDFWTGNI